MLERYTDARALNPWFAGFAVAVKQVIPVPNDSAWMLVDARQRALPMRTSDPTAWTLAALSGGNPVDLVAHFDGAALRPLAAFTDGALTPLIHDQLLETPA